MTSPKFPVKPIGSFKHSDAHGPDYYDRKTKPRITFRRIRFCKGYHYVDVPYELFEDLDVSKSLRFCVVYHWRHPRPKYVLVKGTYTNQLDSNSVYKYAILERHATITAASRSLAQFVKDAKSRWKSIDKRGELLNTKVNGGSVRVGDLVLYECTNFVGEGIIWRVVGEKRQHGRWHIQIVAVMSATKTFENRSVKTLSHARDLRRLELLDMASCYAKLGNFIKEESKRLASHEEP